MLLLFGEKFTPFVGQVNYNRPFLNIGRKKQIFAENMKGRQTVIDRWEIMIDHSMLFRKEMGGGGGPN